MAFSRRIILRMALYRRRISSPTWQRWLFRPITYCFFILQQCSRHNINSYLIVGIIAILLSDILRMFDGKYLLPSLALVFLSYILYMVSFITTPTLFLSSFTWVRDSCFIIILAIVWTKLDKLAIPAFNFTSRICYVLIAGEKFFYLSNDYNYQ